MSTHQRLIGVAECLPKLSLPRADSPATIAWSQGTQASVVVFPHLRPCPQCDRYLADLNQIGDDLRQWATRLLVVVPTGEHGVEVGGRPCEHGVEQADRTTDAAPAGRPTYTVLVDEDSAARHRVGVSADDVAVIVADRYGAVYQVSATGADHFLPDPRDLVDLAKFIDIQCPECEVPSAEWGRACPLPLG